MKRLKADERSDSKIDKHDESHQPESESPPSNSLIGNAYALYHMLEDGFPHHHVSSLDEQSEQQLASSENHPLEAQRHNPPSQ